MASASPAAPVGNAPARPGGAVAAPKIGEVGYKFRNPVESLEGQNERREHERLRKATKRSAAAAVAAAVDRPAPLPPVTTLLPGNAPAPACDQNGPQPGAILPDGDPPPVPWQPELLNDLLSELLDAAEEGRVAMFAGKCQEAGLMPKLCKEIEADAHFPKMAKVILKRSLPRLACKWLNATGISAEYHDEVAVVTALLLIIQSDRKNSAKLDELIAAKKTPETKTSPPPAATTPAVLPDPQPFGPLPVTC